MLLRTSMEEPPRWADKASECQTFSANAKSNPRHPTQMILTHRTIYGKERDRGSQISLRTKMSTLRLYNPRNPRSLFSGPRTLLQAFPSLSSPNPPANRSRNNVQKSNKTSPINHQQISVELNERRYLPWAVFFPESRVRCARCLLLGINKE